MGHGALLTRIGLIVLGLSVIAFDDGCSPVHDKAHDLAGAFSGTYDSVVAAPSADVVRAAQGAVDDLHLILINETKESDQSTAIVIARSSSDEKVTVTVVPEGTDATRFTVTTGVFGNSVLRQQVMDAIKLRLGNAVIRPVSPTTATTSTTVPNYTTKTVPY